MTTETIDFQGYGTSELLLILETQSLGLRPGDVLEVVSDSSTFEEDVHRWCVRNRKILLWINEEGAGCKRAMIKM